MASFLAFDDRNLDISFIAFRPTVVVIDDLVEALKYFCLCTQGLGCLHSAVLRSIHGNMIIWYGAWMKRSDENKKLLAASLASMLKSVSSMAILLDHSFFEAYAGESREGCPAAKLFTGDIISMNSTTLSSAEMNENDFSYACLAVFRTRFLKMDGATIGVCLKSQGKPRVVSLFVWKSLQHCYSHILKTDYRKTITPYLDGLSLDLKYDIFRVVYVSGINALNIDFYPSHNMLENGIESKDGHQVVQDLGRVAQ